jgi:hypothetical protein
MSDTRLLQRMNFGAPAAERDIAHGLQQYFVESEAYRRVSEGSKTIILGNRGAGKSAIFKVLAERERQRGCLVLEMSPEDYSYEMLSAILLEENKGAWAKQGAYASAWKYLLYVQVMKGLDSSSQKQKTDAATRIHAYLRDNHAGAQATPIDVLISYLKRIEGLKVAQYEASVKTRELTKLYKLEEIVTLLPDLKQLCHRRKVIVLIDELDRGWDASEDAKSFVAGLFQACVSINELTPDLRVFISLRRELYDSIPSLYDDAQKYRDIIELITWDEPELLSLVAKRIKHSAPELSALDDQSCWNAVFAETLDYRRTRSFNYMIDRTLYRPREIIQFCTEAVDTAGRRGTAPLNYSTVSNAELSYSEARSKDIAAEYRFQYPGLLSIFEVFRGRTYTFDRADLELLCVGITIGEHRIDDDAGWVLEQDPDYLIEVLWRIGFLRAQAVGGVKALRRSGSSYLGPHQVATLNLRNSSRFHVHPMFRSYLGMKEARERPDDSTTSIE